MNNGEGLGRFDKNDGEKKKQGKNKWKPRNLKCFQCHKKDTLRKIVKRSRIKKKEQSSAAATVEEKGYESAGVFVATKDV